MRQWNVNPKFLCSQHLLGEHYEMHKAMGAILHHKHIQTYIDQGLLFPADIPRRHEELVQEMAKRGMEHLTPLPAVRQMPTGGSINESANLLDLKNRCSQCRTLIDADGSLQMHDETRDYLSQKRKHVIKKSANR